MSPAQIHFERGPRWLRRLAGVSPGPLHWLGVVALAGALLFLLATAWALQAIGSQLQQDRQALAALEAQRQPLGAGAKPTSQRKDVDAERRRAWNQLAAQLNTPWSQLLDTLEGATPDGVALVSIEPDGRQGSVRLQAEARSLETLLAYAGSLRQAPLVREVRLLRHETNEQDATRPLRLTLDLQVRDVRETSR
jgi:Tfp pilus assembly protein PilN